MNQVLRWIHPLALGALTAGSLLAQAPAAPTATAVPSAIPTATPTPAPSGGPPATPDWGRSTAPPLAPPPEAVPAESVTIRLWVILGGFRKEYTFDVAGIRAARNYVNSTIPGAFANGLPLSGETATARILRHLLNEPLRLEVLRVIGLGGVRAADLELHSGDSTDQIFADEILIIPPRPPTQAEIAAARNGGGLPAGRNHRVRQGENLSGLAVQFGVTQDAIVSANPHRFRVWPHAQGTTIRIGESQVSGTDDQRLFDLLLHESAHIGDISPRRDFQRYGPDGKHWDTEIISAAAAFGEGWANYCAWRFDPSKSTWLENAPYSMFIEGMRDQTFPKGGRWMMIDPADLFWNDHFSNEWQVARLLYVIESLPAGRSGVEEAYRQTQRIPNRTLAMVIGAYLTLYPEAEDALFEAIEKIVNQPTQSGPTPPLLRLRAPLKEGQLPYLQAPAGIPRSRLYINRQVANSLQEIFHPLVVQAAPPGGAPPFLPRTRMPPPPNRGAPPPQSPPTAPATLVPPEFKKIMEEIVAHDLYAAVEVSMDYAWNRYLREAPAAPLLSVLPSGPGGVEAGDGVFGVPPPPEAPPTQ